MFSLIWLFAGLAILPVLFNGNDSAEPQTDDDGDGGEPDEGGPDNGIIRGTTENDLIDGGDDGATINAYPDIWDLGDTFGNDTLYGGASDDSIGATSGHDLIDGEGGSDTLSGWEGNDTVYGGLGDDRVEGSYGDNFLYGGTGNDVISARDGFDSIYAGEGDDRIWDMGGAGVMDGGAGDDSISFHDGALVTAGVGADALYLTSDLGPDATGRAPAMITDFDPAQDTLQVVLNLTLPSAGTSDQIPVFGLLDWQDGNGADLMHGDQTIARILGGQDIDPADLDVIVYLHSGDDATFSDGEFSTRILAGTGKDVIYGGAGDDHIDVAPSDSIEGVDAEGDLADGGAGNDTLIGRGGDTYLDRPDEDDTATGSIEVNLHEDTLVGGAGDDVLRAVNGSEMTGGAGDDRFEVVFEGDDLPGGAAYLPAVITDFDPAADMLAVAANNADEGAAWSVVVWADGLGADVLLGTTVVAAVTGGQGLTVADLVKAA